MYIRGNDMTVAEITVAGHEKTMLVSKREKKSADGTVFTKTAAVAPARLQDQEHV